MSAILHMLNAVAPKVGFCGRIITTEDAPLTAKERRINRRRAYYIKNKEKVLAQQREYYRANAERKKAWQKAYAIRTKEERAAYHRKYRAAQKLKKSLLKEAQRMG